MKPFLLFFCSATLWLTLINRRKRSCHDNDDDDDGDGDGDGDDQVGDLSKQHHHTDHIIYSYRRDTSPDFQPNNSNWTHFETNNEHQPHHRRCRRRTSQSSIDSYTDNILRGKEYSRSNGNSSTTSSPHSNAQRCLPSKLILIRHGQSLGNVDESLYATKPDNAMGLTKLGWEMARMAGKALRGNEEQDGLLPPGESVHFIVSPYARTVETFHGIASAWIDPEEIDWEEEELELAKSDDCNDGMTNTNNTIDDGNKKCSSTMKRIKSNNIINDYNGSYHNTNNGSSFSNTDHHSSSSINIHTDVNYNKRRCKRMKLWYAKLMKMGLTWHEDPRIREQDFGNYQDPKIIKKCKAERHKFGSFYYRYPHGESASDVYDRVSTFLDSLWRSFESGRAQNYVIVAHGVSIRVFLARYFRYSIDQFHMLANPKNCEIIVLGHDGLGRLKLDGRCELELSQQTAVRHVNDVGGDGSRNGGEEEEGGEKICRANGKENVGHTASSSSHTTTIASTPVTVVTGYKRHSRLRTIPPQWVYPRTVRMCYNDM